MIDNEPIPPAVLLWRLALGVMFLGHAMLIRCVYTIPGPAHRSGMLKETRMIL